MACFSLPTTHGISLAVAAAFKKGNHHRTGRWRGKTINPRPAHRDMTLSLELALFPGGWGWRAYGTEPGRKQQIPIQDWCLYSLESPYGAIKDKASTGQYTPRYLAAVDLSEVYGVRIQRHVGSETVLSGEPSTHSSIAAHLRDRLEAARDRIPKYSPFHWLGLEPFVKACFWLRDNANKGWINQTGQTGIDLRLWLLPDMRLCIRVSGFRDATRSSKSYEPAVLSKDSFLTGPQIPEQLREAIIKPYKSAKFREMGALPINRAWPFRAGSDFSRAAWYLARKIDRMSEDWEYELQDRDRRADLASEAKIEKERWRSSLYQPPVAGPISPARDRIKILDPSLDFDSDYFRVPPRLASQENGPFSYSMQQRLRKIRRYLNQGRTKRYRVPADPRYRKGAPDWVWPQVEKPGFLITIWVFKEAAEPIIWFSAISLRQVKLNTFRPPQNEPYPTIAHLPGSSPTIDENLIHRIEKAKAYKLPADEEEREIRADPEKEQEVEWIEHARAIQKLFPLGTPYLFTEVMVSNDYTSSKKILELIYSHLKAQSDAFDKTGRCDPFTADGFAPGDS